LANQTLPRLPISGRASACSYDVSFRLQFLRVMVKDVV
jgi:hypothetical protein